MNKIKKIKRSAERHVSEYKAAFASAPIERYEGLTVRVDADGQILDAPCVVEQRIHQISNSDIMELEIEKPDREKVGFLYDFIQDCYKKGANPLPLLRKIYDFALFKRDWSEKPACFNQAVSVPVKGGYVWLYEKEPKNKLGDVIIP